jgi:hypothetical protein
MIHCNERLVFGVNEALTKRQILWKIRVLDCTVKYTSLLLLKRLVFIIG